MPDSAPEFEDLSDPEVRPRILPEVGRGFMCGRVPFSGSEAFAGWGNPEWKFDTYQFGSTAHPVCASHDLRREFTNCSSGWLYVMENVSGFSTLYIPKRNIQNANNPILGNFYYILNYYNICTYCSCHDYQPWTCLIMIMNHSLNTKAAPFVLAFTHSIVYKGQLEILYRFPLGNVPLCYIIFPIVK